MDVLDRKRYFIKRHGRQDGPFTKEQLRALHIVAETSIWNEEAYDWMKAETFEELQDVLNAPSPRPVHRGPLQWLRIGHKHRP